MTPIKNIQRLTQPAHVTQITCLALNDSRSYLLSTQVHCGGPDPVLINLQRSFAAHFKENYMSSICNEAHKVPVSFPFFLSLFKKTIFQTTTKQNKKSRLGSSQNKAAVLVELCCCLKALFVWSS